MRRSLHPIQHVQVVGHYPGVEQRITDDEAREIMRELLTLISGYMVPKLAREIGGEPSKTPLDLGLKQRLLYPYSEALTLLQP